MGTVNEDIDHHARRTYRIVYAHFQDSILQEQMYEAFLSLQSRYDGAKKAVVGIGNYAYATPVILGLIALIDGRATHETLWPQHRLEGNLASIWQPTRTVITRETYREWFENMVRTYGPHS